MASYGRKSERERKNGAHFFALICRDVIERGEWSLQLCILLRPNFVLVFKALFVFNCARVCARQQDGNES